MHFPVRFAGGMGTETWSFWMEVPADAPPGVPCQPAISYAVVKACAPQCLVLTLRRLSHTPNRIRNQEEILAPRDISVSKLVYRAFLGTCLRIILM